MNSKNTQVRISIDAEFYIIIQEVMNDDGEGSRGCAF